MLPIISLKNVSKIFEDRSSKHLLALKDIDLEILEGEFFIVLGPSGSGKSTLLRIMSHLEKDYEGKMQYEKGLTLNDIGFVFQQFALLPWLTVYDNIELGLLARHAPPEEKREKVMRELKRFGLEKFAASRPRELSGGMRQRVGIARALATDPKVIFMDEPFSELDSFTAEELRRELLKIWQERKPTIVMVTHMIQEAIELADRIAVLSARPGHIEEIIKNDLPRPRQKRSADFFRLEDKLYRLVKP